MVRNTSSNIAKQKWLSDDFRQFWFEESPVISFFFAKSPASSVAHHTSFVTPSSFCIMCCGNMWCCSAARPKSTGSSRRKRRVVIHSSHISKKSGCFVQVLLFTPHAVYTARYVTAHFIIEELSSFKSFRLKSLCTRKT